jgi:aminodeoxyfutalosine deaminase
VKPTLFIARWILPSARVLLDGGGLVVAEGRITGLGRSLAEARRLGERAGAEVADLGEAVITPGLIDAHAHLELGALRGKLPGERGMVSWIGALLEEKAKLGVRELEEGVLTGGQRLRDTGTTLVGDIDSTGAAHARLPLRTRVYRELLDARDPARTAESLEWLEGRSSLSPDRLQGVAPHAPHTTGGELLAGCARSARRLGVPLTIHWAESSEEVQWLRGEGGPFAPLFGKPPGDSGLKLIEGAGLLGPTLSLVHANHPDDGDLSTVAASGASVVHCPGTHAFFDRDPVPLEKWNRIGLEVALGTDSLASNEDLDLRREMALVRSSHPGLSPETVFDWATRGGARALGLEREAGVLRPGAWADLAVFSTSGGDRESLLDAITAGIPSVLSTWIGGVSPWPPLHQA